MQFQPALRSPTIQKFTANPTGATNYAFTVTSANATIGATFTNNGQTFTVLATIAASTLLYCSGTGTPASSGTLTKSAGTGDATITFSAFQGAYIKPSGVGFIKVKMVGAGGGGSGGGTASIGSGGTGGNTTFGTSLLSASGGVGGPTGSSATGGIGGAASLGTGPIGLALQGGSGGGGYYIASSGTQMSGGVGGASPFGGAGSGGEPAGASGSIGKAAVTNSGSGGGGASNGTTNLGYSGTGGGAGGFVDAIITNPSAMYAYSVGAAGAGGTAGTNGTTGGAGASGLIVVEEYYT